MISRCGRRSHPAQPRARRDVRFAQASTAQPRAILFHPPDPPIASQSITRDVRFAQASTAHIMVPPSSLVQFSKNSLEQSKRVGVSMLLPSWLLFPLDGVVAMLVLLRPWTSTDYINGPAKLARTLSGAWLV
jgi:hypothetical protein